MISSRVVRYRAERTGDFTDAQWMVLLEQHGYRCYYCGQPSPDLTREHKIPLSRGGLHTASNIVPACRSCNSRKAMQTPEEWAERQRRAAGQEPLDDPDLLVSVTTAEAAQIIGCDPSHVRRLARKGTLTECRMGAHVVLYRRADVEAYAATKHGGWPRGRPRKPRGDADGN